MKLLKKWKKELGISHWDISTERIDPKQVMYGDEKYFIGITIDWDKLRKFLIHQHCYNIITYSHFGKTPLLGDCLITG